MRFPTLAELDAEAGKAKADPAKLAVTANHVELMTASNSKNGYSGTGDKRPPVYREGCFDAMKHPSRMGDRLVYADGRTEKI